jgi:hypothetical protein
VTGRVVEKALKEGLGFSPKGDVRPIGGLPRQEGKAKRVFYRKAGGGVRSGWKRASTLPILGTESKLRITAEADFAQVQGLI